MDKSAGEKVSVPAKGAWGKLAVAGGLLGAVFLWSYWPALGALVDTWNHVQDYSHGYLVLPLAVLFLWARRDRMPAVAAGLAWPGLAGHSMGLAWGFFSCSWRWPPGICAASSRVSTAGDAGARRVRGWVRCMVFRKSAMLTRV